MTVIIDEAISGARRASERAVFFGEYDLVDPALAALAAVTAPDQAAEAQIALLRGKLLHNKFLQDRSDLSHAAEELACFRIAQELFRELGDVRGEAETSFWLGCYTQVVQGDDAGAVPFFEHSLRLADSVGDRLTASYDERHLGFAAQEAGDLDEAVRRFEESTRLRREAGFAPGVAANLVGLVFLSVEKGDRAAARQYFDEAAALVAEIGAEDGVGKWLDEARQALGQD